MIDVDPRDIRRILVREVNWVGDAVLTLPALEALRGRFPQAEISLLAKPWVAGLFADHPAVDRIIAYRFEDAHRGIRGRWRLAKELRDGRFDLAVLLPNSLDAALVAWLAGIPRRVGYPTDCRGWLLTHRVPRDSVARGAHQVERYLGLVRWLGGDGAPRLRLPVTAESRERGRQLLRGHGIADAEPVVALNPGSIYGSAKRWPADRFAAVGDALAERGTRIVLIGSAGERPVLNRVAAHMRRPAVNLAGRTDLRALAGILERAELLVSNDTGAMHVAAAAGTPLLAVFGPTDPVATGPLGPRVRIVREPVPCSPCLLRECPIDHRCMTRIGVEQVLHAARNLLDPSRGSRLAATRRVPGSPAAFLDRDGTIIEDPGYLRDPDKIQFIPGAIDALRALQAAGYRLVLVTNQAGVARDLLTEEDVRRVNGRLTALLAEAGVRVEGIYYCPHHPEHGPPEYRRDCDCRKPKPGMIHRAIRDLGLDPSRSVVIGDHGTDAALARAFPGMLGIMLRTGHGAEEWRKIQEGALAPPEHVADDLKAAVAWFLARRGEGDGNASRPA